VFSGVVVIVVVVVVGDGRGGGGSDVILQKFLSCLVASRVCQMCNFAVGERHVFNAIG
jgi:hypothetical protein